jgi:phosphate:Na+ symporter
MFRSGSTSRTRDLGRVAIGLGLMIWALGRLLAIVTPYESAEEFRVVLTSITSAPVLLVLLSALLTWAAHSSVAVVLLVMSLASKGLLTTEAAFALVIGANLGTAINPLLEATYRDAESRRVGVGNLVTRVCGGIMALALLDFMGSKLILLDADPARAIANFHTVFNVALAVLFLPLLGPYSKLLCRWLPSQVNDKDPARPMYLDTTARETPPIALAGAAREALRMADVLEAMLVNAIAALIQSDRGKIVETKRMDDVLDKLNHAIKSYLTAFDPDSLPAVDNRRLLEILAFATNIEHAGDVLVRNVMALTSKKLKQGLVFSIEGEAEIRAMLERLAKNLRSAAAVFMTQDARAAQQLAQEKASFRELETNTVDAHFARLRSGRLESAQTSSLHLDLIRDLKRINAHLVAAAVSPVMRERGLSPDRLST